MLGPIEKYNLKRFCQRHELDPQLIDSNLSYEENLERLKSIASMNIQELKPKIKAMKNLYEQELLMDLKEIIDEERKHVVNFKQLLKKIKYKVGERILQAEHYLQHEYGDRYIKHIAYMLRTLGIKGYSESQLYACVAFARLIRNGDSRAKKWLEDEHITWTQIYKNLYQKEKGDTNAVKVREPKCGIVFVCDGDQKRVTFLRIILLVFCHYIKYKHSICRGCSYRKLCAMMYKMAPKVMQYVIARLSHNTRPTYFHISSFS